MDKKDLTSAFKKTAELLSEAYDIDPEWTAQILEATFVLPENPVPPLYEIKVDQPFHPDNLEFCFRPNVYSALRSLDPAEVKKLFGSQESRDELKKLEILFHELQLSVPLTGFTHIKEKIPAFKYHLHLQRAGVRYFGSPAKPFLPCGILDRYFTNRMVESVRSEATYSDRGFNGRQSQYNRFYWEFKAEGNLNAGEKIVEVEDTAGEVAFASSNQQTLLANPDAPKIPFPDEYGVIQKKRRGTIFGIFGLKVLRDIEGIDFDETARIRFIEQFVLFREFNRRPSNVDLQIKIRDEINSFIKIALDIFERSLDSVNSNSMQSNLAKAFIESPLNKLGSYFLDEHFNGWDFPEGLNKNDLYLKDIRLDRIFEFARVVDLNTEVQGENNRGIVRSIQKDLVFLIDKFVTDEGDQGHFYLSLYSAIHEIGSIDPIRNACQLFSSKRNLFVRNIKKAPALSFKRLESLSKKLTTVPYLLEDSFKTYLNPKKKIKIEFGHRQQAAIKVLLLGGHTSKEKALRATDLIRSIYLPKEQIEKLKRLNGKFPWRLENEVFTWTHDAIKSGLIQRGEPIKIEGQAAKERTYYLNLNLDSSPKKTSKNN